jgi:hypothetical protein
MQCEHEGCGCEAQQGERYCSDSCRQAGSSAAQSTTGNCGCGHRDCKS